MASERTPPQDLDPLLAERLHQLRHRLGLSVGDMALRLGLWGANGADNLRQMERCARPLPGTLQVLLGYMEREATLAAMVDNLEQENATAASLGEAQEAVTAFLQRARSVLER